MKIPDESDANLGDAPSSLDERVAQLREILKESSGEVIDSLTSELDIAIETLSGKALERKLDEIEGDLMADDFDAESF